MPTHARHPQPNQFLLDLEDTADNARLPASPGTLQNNPLRSLRFLLFKTS